MVFIIIGVCATPITILVIAMNFMKKRRQRQRNEQVEMLEDGVKEESSANKDMAETNNKILPSEPPKKSFIVENMEEENKTVIEVTESSF